MRTGAVRAVRRGHVSVTIDRHAARIELRCGAHGVVEVLAMSADAFGRDIVRFCGAHEECAAGSGAVVELET